ILFIILQDKNGIAVETVQALLSKVGVPIQANIVNVTENHIIRCLACDICPTHIDIDEDYRCIISKKTDDMHDLHVNFLDCDAIVPVVYSAVDDEDVVSNYQKFMERTRYLRRGDYVMGDHIVAPLVVQEVGTEENMAIRILTSMLRHHTVMAKPIVLNRYQSRLLNLDASIEQIQMMCSAAQQSTVGRIVVQSQETEHLKYHPVGYILSAVKDAEDEKLNKRRAMMDHRREKALEAQQKRISKIS
ncbi:MAG: hypothetical protein KC713_03855, partial [Candidatus Omnitrophica bacterium]|nr:hypothetical protein [Candidatus Omnitrophota bacterium]